MLSSGAANGDDRDYETADASRDGLRDHLLWQMRMSPMGASDQAIAAAIIDAIDDDGYLQAELTDIAASLDDEVEPGEIEAVLHQVQSYDPPGVAARRSSTWNCSAARTSIASGARWASAPSTCAR
jgi:RNA polymerase sigma-54 factor